jgi:hypothetical protein
LQEQGLWNKKEEADSILRSTEFELKSMEKTQIIKKIVEMDSILEQTIKEREIQSEEENIGSDEDSKEVTMFNSKVLETRRGPLN